MVVVTIWAVPAVAQRACSFLRTFEIVHIESAELRYRLIDKFGPVEFCDPDCPSSCRISGEKEHAVEAFPQIRKQEEAFRAIVQHLGLGTVQQFSSEQQLAVYREYKKLVCGLSLEMQGESRKFGLTAQGFRIEGIVSLRGAISVTAKEPTHVNCPK
jgi:hypothetical protein